MTTPNTVSVSNSVFCRKKGKRRGKRDMGKAEIAEKVETAETAEGPAPVSAPAPATTLEIVHE